MSTFCGQRVMQVWQEVHSQMKRLASTALALAGLHQPDELVRLEIAAAGHRAAAGALGALVAAHGRSAARGFHLAGQARRRSRLDLVSVTGGHFFSSEPASTDSLTALTLR